MCFSVEKFQPCLKLHLSMVHWISGHIFHYPGKDKDASLGYCLIGIKNWGSLVHSSWHVQIYFELLHVFYII
jgi:hypothetical protein